MKRLLAGVAFLYVFATAYAPFELSRYIIAYRERGVIPTILDTNTKMELAGMWVAWIIGLVALVGICRFYEKRLKVVIRKT